MRGTISLLLQKFPSPLVFKSDANRYHLSTHVWKAPLRHWREAAGVRILSQCRIRHYADSHEWKVQARNANWGLKSQLIPMQV